MRGSALVTTVLESIATNIASSSPLSASNTSRCDICGAAAGAEIGKSVEGQRLLLLFGLLMVAIGLFGAVVPARRGLRVQPTDALKET